MLVEVVVDTYCVSRTWNYVNISSEHVQLYMVKDWDTSTLLTSLGPSSPSVGAGGPSPDPPVGVKDFFRSLILKR